ncbi:hypothetical protein [Nocardioides alcanivorans]|uniref:hypothetical protein n=1 Tax=Nocardioides alcanivorans TaxID=2897352 RepID=UPI001F2048BC|nr:hypothetical protein [Nocardioides alcanivorans]
MDAKAIPGDTPADRVLFVLNRNTKMMQKDPNLTEALTRAFMFADATVTTEIHAVGLLLTGLLNQAMDPTSAGQPTDEQVALARVIGDVWLAALVGWVTGRTSAEDVSRNMSVAIHLLLR